MNEEPRGLDVWLGGRVVADLTVNRRQVAALRYRDDYVAERGEEALGLCVPLPVSSRRFKGDLVDRWIESLLPEGETRTVLEQYFRVRRGDGFTLLAALGRDCAGAVTVLSPAKTSRRMPARRNHLHPQRSSKRSRHCGSTHSASTRMSESLWAGFSQSCSSSR
jgi:HipA-like protein